MVNKYDENTQNTNKKTILASDYGTNWSLVVYENFIPPQKNLYSAHPRLEMKSLQTFLAIKRSQQTKIRKVIKQSRSSLKTMAHMCAISG